MSHNVAQIKRVTWVGIVVNLGLAIVKFIAGFLGASQAVIANAWHHRSDALSSVPVLIAVAASTINPNWAFMDRIGAFIVSIFILKVSWDIIWPSISDFFSFL